MMTMATAPETGPRHGLARRLLRAAVVTLILATAPELVAAQAPWTQRSPYAEPANPTPGMGGRQPDFVAHPQPSTRGAVPSMLTAQAPETSPGDGRLVVSLADAAAIGGRDGMLTGGDDGMSFALVLPPVAPAREVRLILTYENAIDILPEASVLEVTFNDRQVAQLPLTAYAGAKTARIRLQPEYLAPGINRIRLHMLARHRAACGPQASYDLWTRPIVDRSMVEILYAHPPAAPDLATMGDMMAIPTAGGDPLTVLYPTARIDENMLGWGGLATQAYALRLGDRPAPVRALPVPRAAAGKQATDPRFPGIDLNAVPGTKIILAGMKSDLAPLLSPALTARISGPYLGVFSLPGEHRRLLIVASGPTPADVDAALLAMADPRHVLPAQPDAIIQQMGILPAPVLPTLHADQVYKLADFGLETQTTRDYRAVRHLTVRLPADYFAVDDRKVTVRLNASYAGPIEPGAELTAIVNGQVISSIQLNHLSGEELRGREISLPMRLLRAGDNDIEFVATFPSSSKTCVTSPERPVFTLRDDSEIRMPAFARLEELPNLAVLGAVGYPYASDPADRNQRSQPFNLVLPVPEAKAASAAWMILGRLAQRSRSLVSFIPLIGRPPADRNSLIVGALRDLPEPVAAAVATLAPEIDHQWRIGRLAFPPLAALSGPPGMMETSAGSPGFDGGGVAPPMVRPDNQPQTRWFDSPPAVQAAPEEFQHRVAEWIYDILGKIRLRGPEPAPSGLPELPNGERYIGALVQFRASAAMPAVSTLLVAPEVALLEQAADRVIRPALWSSLDGAVSAWGDGPGSVRASPAHDRFLRIGDPLDTTNLRLITGNLLSRSTKVWLMLAAATVLVFGIASHVFSRSTRKRDHE